jgi:acetylornithine deacetylase/succinyl-diaminopimelate desuccinylase-like protein
MIHSLMSRSPTARRFQQASRLALYASLLLVGAATWGLVHYIDRPIVDKETESWIYHDFLHDPDVQLLRDYVRLDTSEATGSEVAGARFLAARLASAGIPSEVEVLDGKHANLYARLDGDDPHPLVLHNHIDVKDVDPKEWDYPPFEARIDLPWMFGRGVFDMKSVAIAQLLAMADLKKSGRHLRRSVLFLGTGSEEEDDSRLGVQWVMRQRPALVSSFWAVLTEGGTVEARSRDGSGIKYWGTDIGQKHFAAVHVCSDSRQRLEDLRQDLKARGFTRTDLRLLPQIEEVLRLYGASRDAKSMREPLADPQDLLTSSGAFMAVPNFVQSMLRNEAVPYTVEPAAGGGYSLLIMLHMLPGVRVADVWDDLLPPWMLFGLAVTVDEVPGSPLPSPTSHPVFQEILSTLKTDFPGATAGPFFLAWTATDARFFRQAGIPAYGFSPFFIMSTDTYQVDNRNERLALPGFIQGVDLYRKLLRRLVL